MDGLKTSFLLGWPIFRGELLVLASVIDQITLGHGHNNMMITLKSVGSNYYPVTKFYVFDVLEKKYHRLHPYKINCNFIFKKVTCRHVLCVCVLRIVPPTFPHGETSDSPKIHPRKTATPPSALQLLVGVRL